MTSPSFDLCPVKSSACLLIMDIKKKLISLVKKQESFQLPVEEKITCEDLSSEPAVIKFKPEVTTSNPQEDQEIIEGIEPVYYDALDPSLHELENLPEDLRLENIDHDRTRLRKQLQCVSRRVSELVLQNHPAYATELQRVMELQKTLQLASIICKNGRGQLSEAKSRFTSASLHLLANVRKRQQLQGVLKSLHTIKTLQRTDLRLREMMEEEDYCGAIQLCLECQKAASTFKHFQCISELSSKLQDTLEMIEEQLDVALSKTCTKFEVTHYQKVQMAYRLLRKSQSALDQHHMHFTSAIHNTAFQIVMGYVELCSGAQGTNFQRMPYTDLCKYVTIESFTPCLVDLFKALWEVMRSYYKTIKWHDSNDRLLEEEDEGTSDSESGKTFDRRYIKQKLEHGLTRIWQDVQQKVRTYILGINLSAFKLDEFIQFLDLVNRMIDIGEDFCQSKSEGLQDSLKQQSLNYFKNHHRAKMEELCMFLENEGWELCPVKSTFHVLNLVEFKFLRQLSTHNSPHHVTSDSGSYQLESPIKKCRFFEEYSDDTSPFDLKVEQEENEDVFAGIGDADSGQEDFSDSDSDVPDELKNDYIDELTGKTHSRPGRRKLSRGKSFQKNVSIVTNTSLNVFRVIGKYMQMMRLLKPIAFDVITCLAQLYDFYMYTVYLFFGTDLATMDGRLINNRLRTTLQRIQAKLIIQPHISVQSEMEIEEDKDKIPQPKISPIVDLNSSERMYGLAERIVAAESLVFIAEQMEFLQPHLEVMIPTNKKAFLQQFYSQTVNMATELRKPVYWRVTSNVISHDTVVQSMHSVKWDVKDLMSQHNPYVDMVIKSFTVFNTRLSDLSRNMTIPRATYEHVWEQIIRLANKTFVEGYAGTRKCSIEGRALMQLDFQQYLKNVEKLVDIRPIPHREYVEAYIKAYYMPENQLETWLTEHKEYSMKQLLALVSTVEHLNRKSRQRLVNMLEETERTKR